MKVLWLFVALFLCYTSLASGKTHYPFKGCFKDDSQRDMKDGVFVQHNSHKFCANRCKGKGYAYFGVQNGQDCWCGHSYNNDKVKHARVKYSECNKPCTGNTDEKCGNVWRMAVYATYNLDKNFIACEHQGTRDLQCPSGSVIKVNRAYYGRQSTTECGNDNTVCVAKGSEQNIVDLCHGKQSCTINPENSVFGDPCYGTVKYVEVDYNCIEGKLYKKVNENFQQLNEEIQQLNEDSAILEKQNEQLQADIKQLHSKDSSFDNAMKELESRFEKEILELKEDNIPEYEDITFTFPRVKQTGDWVKYLLPTPKLRELTVCFWVKPFSFAGDPYVISYANGKSEHNAMLFGLKSSAALDIYFNSPHHFNNVEFQVNKQTHLCIGMSQSAREVIVHQDGVLKQKIQLESANYFLPGGGSLMFGQEQDSTFGGFNANQAFSGNLTNYMMYPRILSDHEIRGIAYNCEYPDHVILRPQTSNIEWNGEATVSYPTECPKLE